MRISHWAFNQRGFLFQHRIGRNEDGTQSHGTVKYAAFALASSKRTFRSRRNSPGFSALGSQAGRYLYGWRSYLICPQAFAGVVNETASRLVQFAVGPGPARQRVGPVCMTQGSICICSA